LKTTYGKVRFVWPRGVRLPFEGRSKGGEVKWGLAERPDLETTNGEALVKAFVGAGDGLSVTLSTSYGDIVVEDPASSAAEKTPGR